MTGVLSFPAKKRTLLAGGVLFLLLAVTGTSAQDPDAYAERMASTILKRHMGSYGGWDYVTGTVLQGYLELWKITGEKSYYNYIKSTVDKAVRVDGSIVNYDLSSYNIDMIKEGCAVLFLFDQTGFAKYKTAADLLRSQLNGHPRTSEGAFWHKLRYPWQIWLDGLYMGSPFLAEYGLMFDEPGTADEVAQQIILAHTHTRDTVTGLYYHGWDEKREQEWADTVTGRSPSFWSRAMGWYAMAIVDVLDFFPENHPRRDSILLILNQFSQAIAGFQDSASGVWWQVTDQGSREGNYLESSASCMFVYALAKAVRKGYLDSSYRQVAEKGFNGILDQFITENTDGTLGLDQVCLTAGLGNGRDGSYSYYVYETVMVSDDGKATGPFMLAAIEIENPVFPPVGLNQDTAFKAGVRLTWRDHSDNETGFLIRKYQDHALATEIPLAGNCESYTDTLIAAGHSYAYEVVALNASDTSKPAYLGEVINYKNPVLSVLKPAEPGRCKLFCFPNPAVDQLTLLYFLPEGAKVMVEVADMAGRVWSKTDAGYCQPGDNRLILDTGKLNPGIYLCRLNAGISVDWEYMVIN